MLFRSFVDDWFRQHGTKSMSDRELAELAEAYVEGKSPLELSRNGKVLLSALRGTIHIVGGREHVVERTGRSYALVPHAGDGA